MEIPGQISVEIDTPSAPPLRGDVRDDVGDAELFLLRSPGKGHRRCRLVAAWVGKKFRQVFDTDSADVGQGGMALVTDCLEDPLACLGVGGVS